MTRLNRAYVLLMYLQDDGIFYAKENCALNPAYWDNRNYFLFAAAENGISSILLAAGGFIAVGWWMVMRMMILLLTKVSSIG